MSFLRFRLEATQVMPASADKKMFFGQAIIHRTKNGEASFTYHSTHSMKYLQGMFPVVNFLAMQAAKQIP
jgi:hypothetical protein